MLLRIGVGLEADAVLSPRAAPITLSEPANIF
jgi:hypothetical protein